MKTYQVLIVEDQPADAELIEIYVRKAHPDIRTHLIQSKSELQEVLNKGWVDLVISDYNLEKFTGQDVLEIVKNYSKELPFILVSGFFGEKKAIEIMVAGADDFVMKDDLKRLGPAVHRELIHYSEYKRHEKLLRRAYSLAEIGHWELDIETNKLFWSEEVKEIFETGQDYSPTLEEAFQFYQKGYHRQHITKIVERAIQKGEEYEIDALIITAKGNERWIRTNGKPEIMNGECVYVYGSVQNITEHKHSEQRLRDVIEHATNLFYRYDTHHKLTYVSPQSHHFFGCPPDKAIQSSWTNFMTDHPVNKKGIELAKQAIKTGKTQDSYILQLRKRDGAIIWVRVNEAPIAEQGKVIAVVGSLTDITSLQMVIEEQEILSKVASETDNMVLITDLDGQITWINDAFVRQTGYRLDEIKGINPARLLSGPKTDPKTAKYIEHKLNNLESVNVEIIQYTKARVPYWAEVDIAPIKDEFGDIFRYFFIQKDITERKEMLARLEDERERLKQAQRLGKIGDWEYDLETGQVTWSAMLFDIFDRDPALDAPSYEQNINYYFEQQEFFKESVRLSIEEAIPYSYDIKIKTEEDNIKYVHLEGTPSLDSDGKVKKLYGIVQDITERKDYLDRLREKRERLEEAQKIGKIGDWDHDVQTDKIFWSDQMFYIFDRDPKLGAPTFEELLKYFPEDSEYYAREVQKARMNDENYSLDLGLRTQNGERKYIHAEGHPKYNDLGELTGIHGIVQDITERKENELLKIAKEKQLRAVTDNVEAMLFRYILKPDGTDQMTYISESIKNIYDVSPEEAMKSTEIVWNQVHEKDVERVWSSVHKSAETLTTWDCRFRIQTLSGELKWVQGKGNPTKLEDGSIQWDSIVVDVTDQVQQERMNEALVQEVHHRVKNNLAIITGFLELQLADLDENSQERLPLERAVTRIYSIAEVHKLLYEGSKLMDINVREYMNHLVDHVTDTMKIGDTFTVELQINDLHMNVNELTPLGMLLNELMTNSMKYAFSDDNEGKITINIIKENDTYSVFYKDNGPGIAQSTFEKAQTSGFNIAKILLAQLEADYELLNKNGFSLSFTFKERNRGAHGNLDV